MSFIAELKRRNVIRMAGLYLVVAWLMLQVAETVLPIYDTPAWVLQALGLLLAIGFVPALVFSWIFELTPDGIKRDAEVTPGQPGAPQAGQRMDRLIFAGLALLIALVAADRYWPRDRSTAQTEQVADAQPASAASEAGSEPAGEAAANTIAVLPFANLSGDPGQEYFSDGMTEELLNVLAKIPELKVAARTSVFQFKNIGGDIREIGQTLGVTHVLEGSVRRDGEQVRITTQLIRVSDGFHVWSETYDRKLESIFAVQDEIAKRVSEQLISTLGGPQPALAARTDIDPVAYDEYLKGRALHRARQNIPTAIFHFRNAVQREPEFAAAWASLALSYDVLVGRVDPIEMIALGDLSENVREGASRAAALAPDAAATLHALGTVARLEGRFVAAEQLYERSIVADPGYADGREDYAELLDAVGREDDALRVALELVAQEPLVPIFLQRVILIGMDLGREDLVLEYSARQLAINDRDINSRNALFLFELRGGRLDAARQAVEALYAEDPEQSAREWVLLRWAQRDPDVDDATVRKFIASDYQYSLYAAARGDANLFFQSLNLLRPDYSGYYAYDSLAMPLARPFLPDPRAKQMLRELGFEAYWREKGWPALCRPLGEDDFECGDFVAQGTR